MDTLQGEGIWPKAQAKDVVLPTCYRTFGLLLWKLLLSFFLFASTQLLF